MSRRPNRRSSHGQSLTELGLMLPLLAVLIAGSAQFGFIVYGSITVDTAAREGARVASEKPYGSGAFNNVGSPAGTTCTVSGGATSSNAACQAVSNAHGMLSGTFTVTIEPQAPPSGSYGVACNNSPYDGYIKVTVAYDTPIFVPFVGSLLATSGSIRTVRDSVVMRVEPCAITNGR